MNTTQPHIKLIVGLGNPGPAYHDNRHNIGFRIVDAFADLCGVSSWKQRFNGLYAEGRYDAKNIFFLKPMQYMNNSGLSIAACAHFHKLNADSILVMHDELNLTPGQIRLKQDGGHGGHNGLRSTIAHMGNNFCRLRFGIGHPGDKNLVSDYVLSNFTSFEVHKNREILDVMSKHFSLLLSGNFDLFMNNIALERNKNK